MEAPIADFSTLSTSTAPESADSGGITRCEDRILRWDGGGGAAMNTTTGSQVPVLSTTDAAQVKDFRESIRRSGGEEERTTLCEQKRDELLRQLARIELLIRDVELVMLSDCPEYHDTKRRAFMHPGHADIVDWARFVAVSANGACVKPRVLEQLNAIGENWGTDLIEHYGLAYEGDLYLGMFRSASDEVPDRQEAIRKLNRLMQRRMLEQPVPFFREYINPISLRDLTQLRAWKGTQPFCTNPDTEPLRYADLSLEELPTYLGFDKYGLIVRRLFATVRPTTDIPPVSEPSIWAAEEPGLELTVNETTGQARNLVAEHNPCSSSVSALNINSRSPGAADRQVQEAAGGTTSWAKNPEALHRFGRAGNGQDVRETTDANPSGDPETRLNTNGIIPRRAGLRTRRSTPRRHGQKQDTKPKASPAVRESMLTELPRCCPDDVPDDLLVSLEVPHRHLDSVRLANRHKPLVGRLCQMHLVKLATIAVEIASKDDDIDSPAPLAVHAAHSRRRRMSFSDVDLPVKKLRYDLHPPLWSGQNSMATSHMIHDPVGDEAYLRSVIEELKPKIVPKPSTHGEETNSLIFKLLQEVQPPNADKGFGAIDAYFLTETEAATALESGPFDMPIVIGSKGFCWDNSQRPISQFFQRMEQLDRSVSVQIPSRDLMVESFEPRKLSEIRTRFMDRQVKEDPWNILDLRCPLPGILPAFMTGRNSQLLGRIRDTVLMGNNAERPMAQIKQWNEWRDVEEWALLSEGGHNTAPHRDSHGLATWITVQEGLFGFGWMTHPTAEELKRWVDDPQGYTGGRWRYVILRPGQTVCFNSGTIHFVFRAGNQQTLAVGGHFLRWTDVALWIEALISQIDNPRTTNEDAWNAPKYVRVVSLLVMNRVNSGEVDALGGTVAVGKFMEAVRRFERERRRRR